MFYNCNVNKEKEEFFVVSFPDLPNVTTYGLSLEHALMMAKEALNGVLETEYDYYHPINKSVYRGGYAIEVEPRIAFAIELRRARAERTQEDVAKVLGMSYQQYQRLEDPKKTNPTLKTIYKIQTILNHKFLRI
ncbi:MAG: type II toxin-antitoxin system HicB family antitoxin [Spirochaetales bacterium]|nr:type II toxin-antitoxin system HicB family antitoxin [Spirochaetales bacterium]MBR4426334.1 type II toxin-antitoxin system HicB family antitoxin [Spirochaetales bacterium]